MSRRARMVMLYCERYVSRQVCTSNGKRANCSLQRTIVVSWSMYSNCKECDDDDPKWITTSLSTAAHPDASIFSFNVWSWRNSARFVHTNIMLLHGHGTVYRTSTAPSCNIDSLLHCRHIRPPHIIAQHWQPHDAIVVVGVPGELWVIPRLHTTTQAWCLLGLAWTRADVLCPNLGTWDSQAPT